MTKGGSIVFGLVAGYAWMLFARNQSPSPVSVWSPWIDWLSFAFGASLWFVSGLWGPFVGGLIVGVHAAQLFFRSNTNT